MADQVNSGPDALDPQFSGNVFPVTSTPQTTPTSTTKDDECSSSSKSGLPPFSSFSDEALSSRFLELQPWDVYGEGLTARLLDRNNDNDPTAQYRPWESKASLLSGVPTFTDAFGSAQKLPSFQSQFNTFAADMNGEITPQHPSFHTLSVAQRYPLVPAPIQAREIPAIQQQFLDERHIQLFQPIANLTADVNSLHHHHPFVTTQTIVHQPDTQNVTVVKDLDQKVFSTRVLTERVQKPTNLIPLKVETRKKEKRKSRSVSLEGESQVAAVSSTAPNDGPHEGMKTQLTLSEDGEKPVKKKRKRCGECVGCQRKDNCGDCAPCRNEKSHQICKMRRCEKLTEKKASGRGESGKLETRGRSTASSMAAPVMPFFSSPQMGAPPPPPSPIHPPDFRERFPNAVWQQGETASSWPPQPQFPNVTPIIQHPGPIDFRAFGPDPHQSAVSTVGYISPNRSQSPAYQANSHYSPGYIPHNEVLFNSERDTSASFNGASFPNGPPRRSTPQPSSGRFTPSTSNINGGSGGTSNGCNSRPASTSHYIDSSSNNTNGHYVNGGQMTQSPSDFQDSEPISNSKQTFADMNHPNGCPGYLLPQLNSHSSSGYPGKSNYGEKNWNWINSSPDSTSSEKNHSKLNFKLKTMILNKQQLQNTESDNKLIGQSFLAQSHLQPCLNQMKWAEGGTVLINTREESPLPKYSCHSPTDLVEFYHWPTQFHNPQCWSELPQSASSLEHAVPHYEPHFQPHFESHDEPRDEPNDDPHIEIHDERVNRLKNNTKMEIPPCTCIPAYQSLPEPGPYYTHLGTAPNLSALREQMERNTGHKGRALRFEKVKYTGKEGKTVQGCPLPKWVIRRVDEEEKVLCVVKERVGHRCATTWIVIMSVAWEGVGQHIANDLYNTLVHKLNNFGLPTSRRCGTNESRTCACQGINPTSCGASFSFGCSWSMYFNGCKYARSRNARKFRLSNESEEKEVEDKMQNLATSVAPLYKQMAPESYSNQIQFEDDGLECRLGSTPERPFTGVTACMDFCAHSHKDLHNMNNGCTVVVTLTKHRGLTKPMDEQLHVLPLYIMDDTDEEGSIGKQYKMKCGLETLSKYPLQSRVRNVPLLSCRMRNRTKKLCKEEDNDMRKYSQQSYCNGQLQSSQISSTGERPPSLPSFQNSHVSSTGERPPSLPSFQNTFRSLPGNNAYIPDSTTRSYYDWYQPVTSPHLHMHRHEWPIPAPVSPYYMEMSPIKQEEPPYFKEISPRKQEEAPTFSEIYSENIESFKDPLIGGVSIALSHGSVLFECAKHELHATTALKIPNRLQPTRISLVFYQHKNMNYRHHGWQRWEEKLEVKKMEEMRLFTEGKLELSPRKRKQMVKDGFVPPVLSY